MFVEHGIECCTALHTPRCTLRSLYTKTELIHDLTYHTLPVTTNRIPSRNVERNKERNVDAHI